MKYLLLAVLALFTAASLPAQEYSFTLNGEPFEPEGVRLQSMEKWAEGDVIVVENFTLMLGQPGAWHFKSRKALRGVLSRVQDGKESPVALKIETEYDDGNKRAVNPLAGLNAADRAGLRGLSIDAPIGNLKEALKDVPVAQLALEITDDVLTNNSTRLPELPAELTWLFVNESSNSGIENLDALTKLTALRGLRLSLMTVETFDARLLAGMKSLRHLNFYGSDFQHPEVLGKLTDLRELDVSYTESLNSVAWCAGLTALEKLNIASTGVEDLSPLAALPALREIEAQNSKVTTPGGDGGFPSLKKLNLLASAVTEESVAAFRKAHPACEVLNEYRESLASAVKGATRVRIRTGGTCHRDERGERTLVEIKTPAEIAALMELLVFEEGEEPFHCMCCGEPSFEFYAGDRMVAMLGFHHGQGMRWAGGPWPGDVHLEGGKAIALCDWLEQHGVKGAGDELREAAREKAALKRRGALYRTIMPGELSAALDNAESAEDAVKLFAEKLPDTTLRARVVFSLYGCSQDSWNIAAGMDEFLTENLLPEISADDLAKLAADPALPAAARRGFARWFFEENKWDALEKSVLSKHLPAIATEGLTSPRNHNRQRTILQLGAIGTPEAVALLRKVLAGEIKAAALAKDEADEPGGMVSYRPDALGLPDDAPDTAHAAALLLRLKDKTSAPAVEKVLAAMPAELREKVRAASKPRE